MSFEFISNLILVLSVVGILVVFLRRVPEVVEEKGQLKLGSGFSGQKRSFLASLAGFIKRLFVAIGKRIWRFMLEAKDFKQGQIIASKFSKIVATQKGKRVINIGIHSSLRRADRLFREGVLGESERAYLEVIKKNPHEYAAYEGLINIYVRQENYGEIQEILEYLIRHNPQNDSYLAQLGDILAKTHRYEEAAAGYEKSLEMDNLHPDRYVSLGVCYAAMGDFEKAKKSFIQALDLDPANVQYLMLLVEIMLKLGQKEEARKTLEGAIEMDSNNNAAKDKLASLSK